MIVSKHYARTSKRPRRKLHPDLQLAMHLEARGEFKPSTESLASTLRGIPAVDAREVRYSPRWKASKQVRAQSRTVAKERKRARVYVAAKRDDRALMARMGSIHGNTQ